MLNHVFVGMRVKTPEGEGTIEKWNRYKSPEGWTSAWVKVRLANGRLVRYEADYEKFEFPNLEEIYEIPEPEYKTPRERLQDLLYELSDTEVDTLLLLLEK